MTSAHFVRNTFFRPLPPTSVFIHVLARKHGPNKSAGSNVIDGECVAFGGSFISRRFHIFAFDSWRSSSFWATFTLHNCSFPRDLSSIHRPALCFFFQSTRFSVAAVTRALHRLPTLCLLAFVCTLRSFLHFRFVRDRRDRDM